MAKNENVGYGYVYDTNVDIHLKKDGKSIQVTESSDSLNFDGYEKMGSIYVWDPQWMCADKKTTDALKHPNSTDILECKVKSGNWGIIQNDTGYGLYLI